MSQQTSEVLYGWKAIAAYLQRGVRTVQRYEHAHQLPVRHLRGKGRGSAMAFRAELDLWLQRSCPSEVPPTRSEDSMVFIQSQAKQLLLDRTLQIHQEVIGKLNSNLKRLMVQIAEAERIKAREPWFPSSE